MLKGKEKKREERGRRERKGRSLMMRYDYKEQNN
jgi:hypothetical protein